MLHIKSLFVGGKKPILHDGAVRTKLKKAFIETERDRRINIQIDRQIGRQGETDSNHTAAQTP